MLKKIINKLEKYPMTYVLMVTLLILLLIRFAFPLLAEPRKFSSDIMETGAENLSGGVSDVSYYYYLDISPTMYGFVNVDGSLKALGQAFAGINDQKTASFYICGSEIRKWNETDFYEYMEDSGQMEQYYENMLTDENGIDDMRTMELSDLFTDIYESGDRFADDENAVTIIVTDCNFSYGIDNDGTDYGAELLDRFAQTLAGHIENADLCIYNIQSAYNGFENDEYEEVGASVSGEDYSFFLIMFSQNSVAYEAYRETLEETLGDYGISLDHKFELRNQPLYEKHNLVTADYDLFHSENTVRLNFNYDSDSFASIEDNALGLRIVRDQGNASISFPVSGLELTGYNDGTAVEESVIDVKTELYDRKLLQYKKCSDTSGIVSCSGRLEQNTEGEWYIWLDLEIDSELNGAVSGSQRCCVIDILFLLEHPGYSLPTWLDTVNRNSWGGNYLEDVDLKGMFETICKAKASAYEQERNTYEKQMGSLHLYINY